MNILCLNFVVWLNSLWLTNSCFSDSIYQLLSLSYIFSSSIIHSEEERLRWEDLAKEGRIAQSQRTTVGEGGSRSSVFAAVWFWLWSSRAWGPNVAALMKRALQPRSSLSAPTPLKYSTPPTISPVPTVSFCLPSHSPILVSFLHTPHSLPACTLPMWSMCCAPAETCWGSRNREYLQISQVGLSSAPTAHSPFLVNHCYNSCNTQAGTLQHTHACIQATMKDHTNMYSSPYVQIK